MSIANIESELAKLWDAQKGPAKTKACLFNLIIYTHEPRRADYMEEIVQMIIEKFPCRIIFIKSAPSSDEDFLSVKVASTSGLKGGMPCDQITIETSAKQLPKIPFIILPHLVPDLPIYLLWAQDPTSENAILPHLEAYATRLIFDSECTQNLQDFSHKMLEQIKSLKIEIMDMNWAMLTGWRDIFAQTFDTPQKIEELSNCRAMRIGYNNITTELVHHSETQAIYLQGWIAAQLNWKFRSLSNVQGTRKITYHNGHHEIVVTLSSQKRPNLPPGAILSVDVECPNNRTYNIERKELQRKVTVHISTLETCDLPFTLPLPNLHGGLNFIKAILYQYSSEHYRNMLGMIGQAAWQTH